MVELTTKTLPASADVIAPDGCEVRLLAASPRGSMAHFTLLPRQVSRAVAHHTVEELWYFLSGSGRMWRRLGEREEIVEVAAGVSLAIPTGARFQLCNNGEKPLAAVAVTIPPWPGDDEAYPAEGPWPPRVENADPFGRLPETLELIELMIEQCSRFEGYLAELRAVRDSGMAFQQWQRIAPGGTPGGLGLVYLLVARSLA